MNPSRAPEQAFYRWVDAQGRLHVVSSLDDVPASERAKVGQVRISGVEVVPSGSATSGPVWQAEWQPEWRSVGVGFGLALVLVWVYRSLPNGWRWVARLAIVAGAAALVGGAYWGWVRRTTGLGAGEAWAAPSALIQDARRAVETARAREQQQAEEIRKIQAEGR